MIDNEIYAIAIMTVGGFYPPLEMEMYVSSDGGMLWDKKSIPDMLEEREEYLSLCLENSTESVFSVNNLAVRVGTDNSIDVSFDGGNVWQDEFDLSEINHDSMRIYYEHRSEIAKTYREDHKYVAQHITLPVNFVYDSKTSNFVFSMGQNGILVRSEEGKWQWVSVGRYSYRKLATLGDMLQMLDDELFLLGVVLLLVPSSLLLKISLETSVMNTLLFVLGWVLWIFTFFIYPLIDSNIDAYYDIFPRRSFGEITWFVSLALGIIMFFTTMTYVFQRKDKRQLGIIILVSTFAIAALFILPYIFWVRGTVPNYGTARAFSLGLMVSGIIAAKLYIEKYTEGFFIQVDMEENDS